MKIDAHQHFWRYNPARDSWIDDTMGKIKRDFMPDDLEPLLDRTGFDGSVAVQANQSEEETLFLLSLADRHSMIRGVVGWTDLRSPDLEKRLEYFSQFDRLKGFRHVLQAEPDGFMTDDRFVRGVETLHSFNFTYDILIFENQLNECIDLLSKLPEMNLVIDHIAKPRIKDRSISEWKSGMKKISEFPHVMVKLSGLVTEADWGQWKKDDFTPYLDTCLDLFGPGRLMIGSDWPVCLLAADYEKVIGIVEGFVGELSSTEAGAVMGGSASEFYNID